MVATYTERPPSLLDASIPRPVERAARKIADRLNTPVHVFHIISGQRKGQYDAVAATDTAWLVKYRQRSSAEEVTVIEPSHDVPVPLHVLRDAQRRADRKGETLHLFRMKDGDYHGVFVSDQMWMKDYRAKEELVAIVEPKHAPNRPTAPPPVSTRQKKETPKKVKQQRTPKVERMTPSEPAPEAAPPPALVPVETEARRTVVPPKARKTTQRVKQEKTVTPPVSESPTIEVPAATLPAVVSTTTTEEEELASAEARMDRLTRLLEEALAK